MRHDALYDKQVLARLCSYAASSSGSETLLAPGDKRVYVDAGYGIVVPAYIPCHGIVENGKRLLEERIVCQALENSAAGDALFHVKLCDAAVGKIGLDRLVWPRSGLYNGGEVVSSAYQAGSPVAMRLSMSRKAFSIASLWYISYMS